LGASLRDLTRGQLKTGPLESGLADPRPFEAGPSLGTLSSSTGDARIVSGSVLSGRRAVAPVDFLGRYHTQISVLAEGRQREFLGWLQPGLKKFSLLPIFASAWKQRHSREFALDTNLGGSLRAIVPVGMYEAVLPLDLVATVLLKTLVTGDTEYAEQLGVLELDEEDLALCSFVCPSKITYGPLLRDCLTCIEKEG